jgi:organic radical activating enzyme
MTLIAGAIKWLHVEASSRCNAWCPACPRNNHGFGLAPGIVEQDLTPARFEQIIASLSQVECVQFCGNFGDPIASAYIDDLVTIAKQYVKKIQIHTNGSIRNTAWWQNFAQQLADVEHDVWFGIDGLKGVHEIYRQGTDFDKIIENAKSFIEAGGSATWQFIPYQHNEHQVIDCLKFSQQLKFKKFKLAKLYRNQVIAKHYKTGEEFDLLPPKSLRKLTNIDDANDSVDPNNCMHLSIPSLYLSASGHLSRCCYMADREKFKDYNDIVSNIINDLNDQICINNCGAL